MFVRTDMSIEQQLVQASHAAFTTGLQDKNPNATHNCSFVIYQAQDQEELLIFQQEVQQLGIKTFAFFEPFRDIGYTAFMTEQLGKEYKEKFSHYFLLGRKRKIILD